MGRNPRTVKDLLAYETLLKLRPTTAKVGRPPVHIATEIQFADTYTFDQTVIAVREAMQIAVPAYRTKLQETIREVASVTPHAQPLTEKRN